PTGQSAATIAGDWRARWVIHVVGPVRTTTEDRGVMLASCSLEALRVADELGARTVAFPAVSAGVYGWPMRSAAEIAVATIGATSTNVDEVRFVLFSDGAYAEFSRALNRQDP
ncbi:MAG: O-acetyl-ADP-ribose deacetylase, partial [Frankiaceae bacterium]|nr:O-acetyl-ADP-ribose deacetylase [Frankiaceae bacterium]